MNSPFEHRAKAAVNAALAAGVALAVLALGACGGGNSNNSNNNTPPPPVNNTAPLAVNLGPANNFVNGLFVSVTVCNPGTATCQTIPDVAVDTGSEGLRILSSQLTLTGLPAETDSSGDALQECVEFADGSFVWGPVVTADIEIAGEKGSSVPIQVISATPSYPTPSACASGGGPSDNTVSALGGNATIGLGNFLEDCGDACAPGSTSVPPLYYLCPNSVCQVATIPDTGQLLNPAATFAQDNNGLLITLPSIPAAGQASASGSLIFGIGTQSDNALGSAKVYTTDANGFFSVTYNNIAYNGSFIDSGSNGLYFLDSTTANIPACADAAGYYCPPAGSPVSYTVTTNGLNGTSSSVTFSIANADSLFASGNAAADDLGGDNTGVFDLGMPFFYGRSVFIGIEGQTSPGGTGPYWAY